MWFNSTVELCWPHMPWPINALTLLTYNAVKAGRTLSIAKLASSTANKFLVKVKA